MNVVQTLIYFDSFIKMFLLLLHLNNVFKEYLLLLFSNIDFCLFSRYMVIIVPLLMICLKGQTTNL